MKPFNLQEALEGKPLVTRDGKKVLDFHYFECSNLTSDYPIIAFIEGQIYLNSYTNNGLSVRHRVSDTDLFMYEAPEEKAYMVAVYEIHDTGEMNLVNSLESTFKQGQTIEITIP